MGVRDRDVVPAPAAPEAQTGVRPVVPETTRGARRRLAVLAIDDQARFVESLHLALEDTHHVETRTSALDALELLRQDPKRFDVVLCDLAMPGIDGATFYERLRELDIGVQFVLMTGGAFSPRAAEFVRSGVCPTIAKPFLLERLLALLDEVTAASPHRT